MKPAPPVTRIMAARYTDLGRDGKAAGIPCCKAPWDSVGRVPRNSVGWEPPEQKEWSDERPSPILR